MAAATLAIAAAVVVYAIEAPVEGTAQPGHGAHSGTERRAARPESGLPRTEAPLVRLSPSHVAVRAQGSVEGDSGVRLAHDAIVLLDTGISLGITTPDGQRLFGLSPGTGEAVKSWGISGVPGELLPTDGSATLHLALVGREDPARVEAIVRYLGADRLFGAHAILPPHLLGPAGGAVRLDFGAARFVACEKAAACLDGGGRVRIWDAPCAARPELVVVRVAVGGATARLLLDTGGATLLSRQFFEVHGLGGFIHESRKSEPIGSGGAAIPGRIVAGAWPVSFGEAGLATVTAKSLWIADAPAGPTAECHLDGALGADALADCALVIADGVPLTAFVRCPDAPRPVPG